MLQGFLQIGLTLVIIAIVSPFLGSYIAQVFQGEEKRTDRVLAPIENLIYSLGNIRQDSMTGWQYIRALLYSNVVMGIFVYVMLMIQGILPLNPTGLSAPNWDLALHTTISFLTNTDQQHYGGETTFSYASQTLALGFLMFTSAATGIAVAIAFIRGLTGKPLGNFYVDLILSITRILLPLSLIGGLLLMIAGIPETFGAPITVSTLEGATQVIPRGAIGHFEIIKQLGENGGGFFNANSAHPLENPNGFTNLIETLAMVIIPAGMIHTYGIFAHNKKQAWRLFGMVFIIYLFLIFITAIGEVQGNTLVNSFLGNQQPNLEGKEVRFGWAQSALWAVTTTATMCGAVNGMLDSFMPTGGFVTLFNMFLQIVWGGQGTGTAYLFVFLILTVFLTGLMVGRTPEFLGRKIEKNEIVLASVILLVHPFAILIPSAITLSFPDTLAGISNPGFHGLTQVVYEYTSAAANNGSGFSGLGNNSLWWNLTTVLSLLAGRYIPIIALLLLADSLTNKQPVPETTGTLRTDSVLFTSVTAGVILILGALTFFPVLALGPIAEWFTLTK
jgi:potassium-transporting ATPase potassium-binding subunit